MGGNNDNSKTRSNKKNTKENDNEHPPPSGGMQADIDALNSEVQSLHQFKGETSSQLSSLMAMMETHHKQGQDKMNETILQVKNNQATVSDFLANIKTTTTRLDKTDLLMNKHESALIKQDSDISEIKASLSRLETNFTKSLETRPDNSDIITAAQQAATEVARNAPAMQPLIDLEELLVFKEQQTKLYRQGNEATFVIRGLPRSNNNPLASIAEILGNDTANEFQKRDIRPIWLKPKSNERANLLSSWPVLVKTPSIRDKIALRSALSKACQLPQSNPRLSFDDYIPSELAEIREKAMGEMKEMRTRLGKDIRAFRFEYRDGQLKTAVRASKAIESSRSTDYKIWTYIETDKISDITSLADIDFLKPSTDTPAKDPASTLEDTQGSPSIPDTPEHIAESLKRMASTQAQQERKKDPRSDNSGE